MLPTSRILLSVLLSCVLFLPSSAPARTAEITVSAASSLSEAFTELAKEFSATSGIGVALNFGSSNSLLRQIQSGAPVDLFASADRETMDSAVKDSLVDAQSCRDISRNELLIVSPPGSRPLSLADLASESVGRIAVGSPSSVPAGRYAREALHAAGLWNGLQGRIIYGGSVRQVLAYVQRGEVDAGIVYTTDAQSGRVQAGAVLEGHSPVAYPMAICSSSAVPEKAQSFLDYVLSEKGQTVLTCFGFIKAD